MKSGAPGLHRHGGGGVVTAAVCNGAGADLHQPVGSSCSPIRQWWEPPTPACRSSTRLQRHTNQVNKFCIAVICCERGQRKYIVLRRSDV